MQGYEAIAGAVGNIAGMVTVWCIADGRAALRCTVIAVSFFCVLSLLMPYWGAGTESCIVLSGGFSLGCVLALYFKLMRRAGRGITDRHLVLIGVFLSLGMSFLLFATTRTTRANRLEWECDGVIVTMYQSTNHLAPSVAIQNADGSIAQFEGIAGQLWTMGRVGDRISKQKYSPTASLNGQTVAVVPPRWASW